MHKSLDATLLTFECTVFFRPQEDRGIKSFARPRHSTCLENALELFQRGLKILIHKDVVEFLEYARVFDHLYGTARTPVEVALAAGQSIILDIDWQGARKVRAVMPEALSVFILPPSLDALERRLVDRGQDSVEVIRRRMQDAVNEIGHYLEFDYILVNQDFQTALKELRSILHARRAPRSGEGFDPSVFLRSTKNGTLEG